MKKLFIIVMAVFLLINSVGYTVYAHYCNDELKEASIITKTESCCEEDEEANPEEASTGMSCCAEKNVLVVLKDHFVKSELSFSALSQPVLFISNNFETECFAQVSQFTIHNSQFTLSDYGPPPDLIILNSVFRI